MSSNVVSLNKSPKDIAHYLRLGQGCHRQLEELQDANALPFNRMVVDASRLDEQQDLIKALLKEGKEIVLDTNMAELSTVGGSAGQARHLPWAKPDGFWRPEDMDIDTLRAVTGEIAEKATDFGCVAVQSPSHLISSATDPWLSVDATAAELLREHLDSNGAQDISVDYTLMIKYAALRDPESRQVIAERLRHAPFEQLWLRIPRFGDNSTGAMTRQYVSAVSDLLRQLGNRPVIADYAGGLPALAVCAFGAVGGIAHGVGEKERFNPDSWMRPRPAQFSGRARRIYVPSMDLYLPERDFQRLWDVKGSRSRLVCTDTCCARGKAQMLDKRHILQQRANQVAELNRIPELSRPEHMLHKQLEPVGQAVRQFERIRELHTVPDIQKKLAKRSAYIDRFAQQMRELIELRGLLKRSAIPEHRGHMSSVASWS